MPERDQPEPIGTGDRPTLTVETLVRWEENGATWRALEIGDRHAVVELCTCYGEPVDTLMGEGTELTEYVRAHRPE